MPTIPSIRTSVENKEILVLDEHAKNGTFRRDAKGRLIAYTGGFSVVFPYEYTDGSMWAFRCWHSDINNTRKRYEIISEAIQKAHLDFLCEFEYIEKGINVEGNIYSTTRMRWVDGKTIKDYICQNRYSKDKLSTLADNFLKMTQALHNQSLAHGDLQHGNIMVNEENQLYLVDYDSFYCPTLKGEEDTVTGLPDYQHPARRNNMSVSEKLDYFSELIIYLSILAIAENPYLVNKYKVEDADRLLFSKEDFEDITNSQIYEDIHLLGIQFQEMLDVLEEYLKCKSIDDLLPFDTFLLEKKILFSSSATKAVRNKQTVVINWDIPFEAKISITEKDSGLTWDVDNNGEKTKILTEDTTYELSVKTNDGKVFYKEITIKVFDECEIDFSADKQHIFPSIPVTLKWKVKNAKKVWLDDEEVKTIGAKIIKPTNAVSVVLTAEDEFGKKEKRINIGMLPIPIIKSLLVPTPNFVSNLSVTIKQPRFNVDVRFPTVDIDWIKLELPEVKSPSESGLFQKLSPPLPDTRFSLRRAIKRVYNHILRK